MLYVYYLLQWVHVIILTFIIIHGQVQQATLDYSTQNIDYESGLKLLLLQQFILAICSDSQAVNVAQDKLELLRLSMLSSLYHVSLYKTLSFWRNDSTFAPPAVGQDQLSLRQHSMRQGQGSSVSSVGTVTDQKTLAIDQIQRYCHWLEQEIDTQTDHKFQAEIQRDTKQ